MKKHMLLLICIFLLSACADMGPAGTEGASQQDEPASNLFQSLQIGGEEMPEQMPEDFDFLIERAFLNYSSFDHSYYYDGISLEESPEYRQEFVLKPEDKEKIWQILRELNIHRYKAEYTEHFVEPPLGADLYVVYDQCEYSIKVTDSHLAEIYPEIRAYIDAVNEIMAILETYPEAKKLPPFPHRIE